MEKSSKKNKERPNFLGIDYGAAKIGLALADGETRIAFSYRTIGNDRSAIPTIAGIIAEENVGTAVVGIPFHAKNPRIKEVIERFGVSIKEASGAEMEYQNEMFSTKLAQQNLIERGAKNIKRFDDQESARIILQDWLDCQKP